MGISLRCLQGPERAMTPHTDLVHFLLEVYASQGASKATPLSACGQGLPVYAAGTEIRKGAEGLTTSDWGNKTFTQAARIKETALSRCSTFHSGPRKVLLIGMARTGHAGKERLQ